MASPHEGPSSSADNPHVLGVGATIIDAFLNKERAHRSVSRRDVDLSTVEVDDVRATALAWLSDIARG